METSALIDGCAAPIHELGGAFYFTPETAAVGERFGLDVFMLYCLGRGGVLGDVDVQQVIDAFIWFKPSVVTTQWEEGRALADPAEVAAAYVDAARAYARRTFKETDVLRSFCDAAESVVAAAPTGKWGLVDGYRRFELPKDTVSRAFQLVVTLRELRGAAHGDAVATVGMTPSEAHFLADADAFELYGYDADDIPAVTDDLLERRALAEDRTTDLLVSSYEVLDDAGSEAFLEGIRELAAHADIPVEDVVD